MPEEDVFVPDIFAGILFGVSLSFNIFFRKEMSGNNLIGSGTGLIDIWLRKWDSRFVMYYISLRNIGESESYVYL